MRFPGLIKLSSTTDKSKFGTRLEWSKRFLAGNAISHLGRSAVLARDALHVLVVLRVLYS